MAENNVLSTSSVTKFDNIHERNDICLRISPFDAFKKISLFKLNEDNTYSNLDADRNDNCRYYLQFGETGKTVRIDEYTGEYSENGEKIEFSPNELMFKITQEKAKEILTLNSNVFYVVREVVSTDAYGDSSKISTQEIFSGRWSDTKKYQEVVNNKTNTEVLKSEVSNLMDSLTNANAEILELNKEIVRLTKENERLQELAKYKEMYEELSNSVEMGTEYTATAIESNAKYINVDIDDETLANRVNDYLDTFN